MLKLETLESRHLPASTLVGGTLLTTLAGKLNAVSFDSVNGQVQVTENGSVSLFSGVTQIVAVGSANGENVIQNNTGIDSTLLGGNKSDTLFGGSGRNVIDSGKGKDVVYALLGTNNITSDDNAADRVFTNFGAIVDADKKDVVVRFFAPGRTPGTPFIGQETDGVLYITPSNNGSRVVLSEGNKKDTVVATFDLGDGLGLRTQTFLNVKSISYFGGSGSDLFINNTQVDNAAYGSAGNDVLFGGVGEFSLLKGSGGDDVLFARADQNDVSGNGGIDLIFALAGQGKNIFRAGAEDVIVGLDADDVRLLT